MLGFLVYELFCCFHILHSLTHHISSTIYGSGGIFYLQKGFGSGVGSILELTDVRVDPGDSQSLSNTIREIRGKKYSKNIEDSYEDTTRKDFTDHTGRIKN